MKRKQNWMTALLLMVGVSLLFSGWVKQESARTLYERALYLEETKGELEQAIDIYKRVVDEFPDERAIAAKAQLQIGICCEKLGFEEAEKAFQKVVDNYPDQTEAFKVAQEKLSLLERARAIVEKEDQGVKVTEIPIDQENDLWSFISPDGKKLASVRGGGDIWVVDIASGEEIRLTDTPEFHIECFWSPDSQKIAYMETGLFTSNLKVVSAQGGTPKTLIEDSEEFQKEYGWAWPTGWSSDNQYINCIISKKGIMAIPVSGGEWRDIFRYTSPEQEKTSSGLILSPNEEYLAYTNSGDIYVMPAKGGDAVQITDHPASDKTYSWSYDGRWLLFTSHRSGKGEFWIIGISPEGKPEGEPFQIPFLSTMPTNTFVCWTLNNQIGFSYGKGSSNPNIFVSNIDGSEEIQLTDLMGGWYPKWSPDNKKIAFISSQLGDQENIWVVSVQGGKPKNVSALLTVRPEVDFTRGINWHPNGRKVSCWTVVGGDRECWTMDIESGDAQKIPFDYDGYPVCLDWSPDGKKIAFCYSNTETPNTIKDSEKMNNIYTVPAEGGEATRLTRVKEKDLSFFWPRWSPDGKRIAFNDLNGSIWTVPSEGGEPQLIVEKKAGISPPLPVDWSPDGETICFYATEPTEEEGEFRTILYSVSSQGGEPRIINRIEGVWLALSPDGKKLAYRKNMPSAIQFNKFWLLDNFLPEKKKDQ